MKVAVIITGYLPYLEETYPNILDRILSKFQEYDIFISTWDLNKTNLKTLKQLYNPVVIDNENFKSHTKYTFINNFKYLQSIPNHTSIGSSPHSIAMWYKIGRALNIVQEYSYENNVEYDLIVRLRTDFFYQNSLTEKEINDCLDGLISIGVHCGDNIGLEGNGHAGDNFFIFKSKYLDFFKLLYFKFYEIWDKYKCVTPEHVLYSYLKESGYPFLQTNLRFVRVIKNGLLSWNIQGKECIFYSLNLLSIKENFYIGENYEINIT